MKKGLLILAALTISASGFAQKSKIYTAKEYFKDYIRDGDKGALNKAIIAINEATTSESTKMDGDAWFCRGEIYEKMAETDPNALEESTKSYLKVLEVKPNYDGGAIDPKLLRIANQNYKLARLYYIGDDEKGVKIDYDLAYNYFKKIVDIRELNDGKHFAANKNFDTFAAQSLTFQAYSAASAKKEDLAIAALSKAKNNPIARDPAIFSALIDIYTQKNDFASIEKTIAEAKVLFPKSNEIQRQEVNYYSRTGKTDILISKMEEAVKQDPDNSMLQYNLGVLYSTQANPIDEKTKPANAKELEAKAEMAYKLAIDADPNKADFHYNLGALYFNNAADITKQMSKLGNTPADDKKYDELKKIKLSLYTKSLPYFQKSYDLLNAKSSLSDDEKATFQGTLVALQTIFESLGQSEKGTEMANKLKTL